MDTPTLNPSPKMREGLQWRKTPLPSLVSGDGGMSSIFTTPIHFEIGAEDCGFVGAGWGLGGMALPF